MTTVEQEMPATLGDVVSTTSPRGASTPYRVPVDHAQRLRRSKVRAVFLLLLVDLSPALLGLLVGLTLDIIFAVMFFGSDDGPGWFIVAFPAIVALAFAVISVPSEIRTALQYRQIILGGVRARRPTVLEEQMMEHAVEEVAIAAGIPTPTLCVLDERAPNAMVVGTPGAPCIAVTTGLLEVLSRSQLEAVAGHLAARVVGGDLRYFSHIAAVLTKMDKELRKAADSEDPRYLPYLPAYFAADAFARGMAGSLSQERVLLADDLGVRFVRNPAALIEALRTIQHDANATSGLPASLAPLFFVDPRYPTTMRQVGDLAYRPMPSAKPTDMHPPMASRIERLRQLLA